MPSIAAENASESTCFNRVKTLRRQGCTQGGPAAPHETPGMVLGMTGANTVVYNRLLLFVAGLGGLLYGIDVGIISGALPYLTDTSGFTTSELSFGVACVTMGGSSWMVYGEGVARYVVRGYKCSCWHGSC